MLNKQNRFSIRKLSVGVASVAVAAFLAGAPAQINAQDGEPDSGSGAQTTAPETKEYSVSYEYHKLDGTVETLQSENGWTDWDAMQQASVVTANSFVEQYGAWDVKANADGLVYVFTEKAPETKEYSVSYEYHKLDGTVETLQSENGWTDWAAMEKSSVATADSFAEKYGAWDVKANADGLVYVFTEKAPETKEYSVVYEVRDAEGNVVETLQSENGWTDWAAMEQASVATANIFAKTYGAWDVEANADGLVYVFTEKEEETDPEAKEYSVVYELRDKDGNVVKTLQTENGWTDWAAMEQASVATANIFAKTYGAWDVEANADGLVYVFTQKEEAPEVKEYSVVYELRDENGKLIEVLQTENGWTDWAAMEKSSVATANIFAKTYGAWDVEANADGLVYVFTQKADPKPTPDPDPDPKPTPDPDPDPDPKPTPDKPGDDNKPGDNTKPGKPVAPSGEAGKATLPETGEASDGVIFSAAALAVLAGVGLVAPSFKKEN